MVDYDVLIAVLRSNGHTVEHVIEVPSNAGTAELTVDGKVITLEQARQLLVDAEPK